MGLEGVDKILKDLELKIIDNILKNMEIKGVGDAMKGLTGDVVKKGYKVKVEATSNPTQPTLTYQWVSDNEIEWVIDNPTDQTLYTGIYRNGYPFGNAFTEVYLRNGATNIWETPEQNTDENSPYRIAFVSASTGTLNVIFPAFVFKVPPKTKLSVPEYGFSKEMPPQDYYLYPAQPVIQQTYLVSYDPMLPVLYTLQTQEPVLSMPSLYPLKTLTFQTSVTIPNIFVRYIIPYNFFTRLIFPVTV